MPRWAVVAILLVGLGVGLRLYRFPHVPAGLQQDEAAAGYEAWSLLETGRDRWGNRFPPYFPSWGSGQSVLLSYLAVPFVARLGIGVPAIRLPALLLGLATLGLFFLAVKRAGGRDTAAVAAVLLALSPWHVMLSRWALDANLLPFTLLLGVFTFSRALANGSPAAQLLSLVPFALTFYSYGLAVLVTPVLVLLLCVLNRERIRPHSRRYLVSLFLTLVLATPFGLFLLKNQVRERDLGIEAHLPFDLPLLPAHRLDQGQARALPTNAEFLLSGLRDDLVWNNLPDVPPLAGVVMLLAAVGWVLAVRERDPFAWWLVSCAPLLVVVPLNVTRANALYLPIVALAARAIVAIDGAFEPGLRRVLRPVAVAALLLTTLHFARHYFVSFPRLGAVAFNRGLDGAIAAAQAGRGPDERLFVTDAVPLNYVYYLFHGKVPPAEFQRAAVYETVPGSGIVVRSLGQARFQRESAAGLHLLRSAEPAPCAEPPVVFEDKWWRVLRCP